MIYRKSRKADEDLIAIYLWVVTHFGVAQAEKYHASLAACFELIADFPGLAAERSDFGPPVRVHRHAAHLVVYRVELDHVLIIRVLYGRQDWQALLTDE